MKYLFIPFLLLFLVINASGQQLAISPADTLPVSKAAGEQFAASGWKKLWWGKHYRKEWTTPVEFQVLHLSAIDGGLTPLKMGGGHETKTLRLMSAGGKEYVLRTMDKNLNVLVPDELKGSFINDIVNDQISTAHPYGPLAIAHMAASISIYHTNPVIYFVPDDPLLGEFRSIFGNKLCLLEERPSGKGWEHTAQFGNAEDIVNTEKLLEKVYADPGNSVDQHTFLRIRFFDMIINDWDRHEDQWVWAKKKDGNNSVYVPVARDRDQAFSKTDGINLFFLSRPWALRPVKNLTPAIPDVRGENYSARNLDLQFLNQLSREDWNNAIAFVQANLTDTAIWQGINAMPKPVTDISGNYIARRLSERKNNLARYGMKYYSVMAKRVTINGSVKNETFLINVKDKDSLSITGISEAKDTFYFRVFNRQETKSVNLYGLEGNDEFHVTGSSANRIKVRMIGGEGDNSYEVNATRKVRLYDSLKSPRHWDTLYAYHRKSVNYNWYAPLIVPGYNKDDGAVIGLGLIYKKQVWGKAPFGWQQQFQVTYAFGTSATGFAYKGLFKKVVGSWDLDMTAEYKGPRYTMNYYGLGNSTGLNNNKRSFFRAKANDFYMSPGISKTSKNNSWRFGLQYESVKILTTQNKFVTSGQSHLDPSVFTSLPFAGVNGQWNFFNAGKTVNPKNGFHIAGGFSYLHNLDNTDRATVRLAGSASVYHTFFGGLTFAHRTGASTATGDFEFYQASTLGGSTNLRGYWRDRFAGRSSFFQNTELRLKVADLRGYVLRGAFGLLAFFDDGRVWLKAEDSDKIHTSYGGGIFWVPYNFFGLNLFYSKSSEASMVTLRGGFFF